MRRNGRPPIDPDDPSVPVNLRLPGREYDQLCDQARRAGVSVPEKIREQLRAARAADRDRTEKK